MSVSASCKVAVPTCFALKVIVAKVPFPAAPEPCPIRVQEAQIIP